jgi:hypothetical protein
MPMVQSVQASELSLREVTDQLNLQKARSENFFSEWKQDLPSLTAFEQQQLDRLKADCHDQSQDLVLAKTVNLIVLTPMLYFAGFSRDPFQLRPEKSIQIVLPSEDQVFRGRIDVFALAHQFWILVTESKEASFSLKESIPHALIAMAATSTPDRPAYSLCTNGSHWLFLKLDAQARQYARSDEFSLYREGNELGNVLQVLKQLGEIVRPIAKD